MKKNMQTQKFSATRNMKFHFSAYVHAAGLILDTCINFDAQQPACFTSE